MQIVIDIPEKVNNRIRSYLGHGYAIRDEDVKIIADAIYNGQTKPKEFERKEDDKRRDANNDVPNRPDDQSVAEEPAGALKINNSLSIAVYDKLPCRFHRWIAKLLLGWEYTENKKEQK